MVEDAWSKRAPGGFGVWGAVLQEAPGQKGPLVVLGFREAPDQKGPFGVWGGVLQEAPGQKGPLVVLGFRAGSLKRHLVKKDPWWFWGLGRGP